MPMKGCRWQSPRPSSNRQPAPSDASAAVGDWINLDRTSERGGRLSVRRGGQVGPEARRVYHANLYAPLHVQVSASYTAASVARRGHAHARGGELNVLALSRSDLRQLVPMKDAVELMKVAFLELSEGRAQAPVRAVLEVNDDPSAMLMMPGYVAVSKALGFKVVNFFSGNPSKRNLPTIHAIVCLIDDLSGEPLGIMEGGYVTALRTGAVSGAASDYMARSDAKVLTVIGAGVQGVTQAAAVCAVRPIEKIIAVDTRDEQLARYRAAIDADWPELSPLVVISTDVAGAVAAADIICTATTARTPVFDDADVKAGTHI